MPSTDRKLELKAKTPMAQTASQAAVYAKGLISTATVTTIISTNMLPADLHSSRSYEKEQEGKCTSLFRAKAFLFLVT
jgi:hypothetical protein